MGEVDLGCAISDSSQVSETRRKATVLAVKCGFDETQAGKIAIIVSEAATNLIKHAGGGHIVLRAATREGRVLLEILALDRGPGLRDPERCLRDGYSTAGSPGTGLGAIQRLSDAVELYSARGVGSAILSRTWSHKSTGVSLTEAWHVGAVCVPVPGESVCGDAWAFEQREEDICLLVADGLGHGPLAAAAAIQAVDIFRRNSHLQPADLMQRIHLGLKGTRGAAAAVMRIARQPREVRFVGLGNISASIIADGQCRSLVSHNGSAGAEARKIQEFKYPLPAGGLVVVHSDGVATHWRLPAFPGLAMRDPSLIAGVLYEHFLRGRDDATVVVLSEASRNPS